MSYTAVFPGWIFTSICKKFVLRFVQKIFYENHWLCVAEATYKKI